MRLSDCATTAAWRSSRIVPTQSRPSTTAVTRGRSGDFGCFSFYVTKNVVTGEGGIVIARRERDAARIKVLALHGMGKDA
jgi:dTDP-4-amino-4,6-dideoxygalactose transaminase